MLPIAAVAPTRLISTTASIGNSFHHNTVIWDPGSVGTVGFDQNDTDQISQSSSATTRHQTTTPIICRVSQPHHLSTTATIVAATNVRPSPAIDPQVLICMVLWTPTTHGSRYPQVSITSPADQSSVGSRVTVSANVADASGINRWNSTSTGSCRRALPARSVHSTGRMGALDRIRSLRWRQQRRNHVLLRGYLLTRQ